jgi:hypothetical protein
MIMKLIKLSTLLCIFLSSCSNAQTDQFNIGAVEYFESSGYISKRPLTFLNETHNCVLAKSIHNDLDKLNNWKTINLWGTFDVRTYFQPFVQLNFQFVKDLKSDRYYFISFPEVDDYFYHVEKYYDHVNDSVPGDSKKHIQEIPCELLNEILSAPAFLVSNDADYYKKGQQVEQMLEVLLERNFDPAKRFPAQEDFDKGMLSAAEFAEIESIYRENLQKKGASVAMFENTWAGFLMVILNREKDKLRAQLYFIPKQRRMPEYKRVTSEYWKECK